MKINKTGFLQAFGVALYCALVAFIMWNGNKIFGQMKSYLGPFFILTLLSTSALICGLLVFYKPYLLFFEGKKKEAIDTVVSTAISLLALLIILLIYLFLTK
ncbi:hypothetical protein HY045_01360 [Candidatus Woesebacteria bacterium]|nr:hypothetical protein [Candidatus Woesebacteria bacterium]